MSRKQEHQIFDGPVKKQTAPFYEVRAKDTVIEYTDSRKDAYEAYFTASLPREVIRIDVVGNIAMRTVVERTSAIRHLTSGEAAARGLNIVQRG